MTSVLYMGQSLFCKYLTNLESYGKRAKKIQYIGYVWVKVTFSSVERASTGTLSGLQMAGALKPCCFKFELAFYLRVLNM